jgi:hypothetical protein
MKKYYLIDEDGNKKEISFNEYMNHYYDENKKLIQDRRKENRKKENEREDIKKLISLLKEQIFSDIKMIDKYNLKKRNRDRIMNILDNLYNQYDG